MKHKYILFYSLIILFGVCCVTQRSQMSNKGAYGGSFGSAEAGKNSGDSSITAAPGTSVSISSNHPEAEKKVSPAPAFLPAKEISNSRKMQRLQRRQAVPMRDSTTGPPQDLPIEKNAQIGFWLALGGIVVSWIPYLNLLALPMLIAGLILGIIGKRNIDNNPGQYRGRGMAIAAIVIPIVVVILVFLILLFYLLFLLAILGSL